MSTNISLTPELEEYAKSQVSNGLYNSVSEFMREAVRMHRKENLEHQLYIRMMHKELAVAASEIDQDQISLLDMQTLTEQAFKEMEQEDL